ncbi:E-selectin [Halotydeus destructor]|nr:E-selectin [Halotydeus destructor]
MSKVQLILAISIWLPLDWCPARGQNTNTCATLSPPVNGFAVFPCSPTAGVTCVFACNQGYSISGIRSTTCRAATGRWTNRVPTCVFNNQGSGSGNGNQGTFNNQITCSALDAPAGGSNSGACMEGSVPGSICTAACPAGFTRGGGGPSYTCQPDGTWTPTAAATCTRITNCPNLVLPANMLGAGNCAPGVVGSTCTFSCAAGAVLDGLALVTCQANGTWSGAVPQCRGTYVYMYRYRCRNGFCGYYAG